MTGPLARLADAIALVNEQNGWFAIDRAFGDDVALLHSEVSEAYEEYRNGHAVSEEYYGADRKKPEGVPSELADILIRVLDTAHRYGINMDAVVAEKIAYNASRGIRHGGKIV